MDEQTKSIIEIAKMLLKMTSLDFIIDEMPVDIGYVTLIISSTLLLK
jgi:hypothetical protein